MSRSGYSEDWDGDEWVLIRYRGAVASAIKGARGQAFLKEMLAAMDALPEKKLVANVLEHEGAVCAMGAVARSRGVDLAAVDPEDAERVAKLMGIASALAKEIAFENDEAGCRTETPEKRFTRVRAWIVDNIRT